MATGGLHDQSGRKEAHAYESGRIAIDGRGLSISFRIIDRNSPNSKEDPCHVSRIPKRVSRSDVDKSAKK